MGGPNATLSLVRIRSDPIRHFATDLVFFLSTEFGSRWHPPGHPTYSIINVTPLSSGMQRTTSILARHRAEMFERKYNELVNRHESRVRSFSRYVQRTVLPRLLRPNTTAGDVLRTFVKIARLGLVFYERGGANGAPNAAVDFIIEEMKRRYDYNFLFVSFFDYTYSVTEDFNGGMSDFSDENSD